jgi:beta-lactamase class A
MNGERKGNPDILARIERALEGFSGVLGLYAKELTTGEEVSWRADAIMPTASVIKVGIMAELYRQAAEGLVDLDARITLVESDWTGGTGVLKELMPGLQPTVTDLCRLMIIQSDNVATHVLVRMLGKEKINASLRTWGLPNTELRFNMELGGDIRQYAVSTPRDLGRLYEAIATDGIVSAEACAAMRDHLGRQQHLEQIGRGIPSNPFGGDLGLPRPVRLYNKIGNYMGVRADAAIVESPRGRFVLATMNEGSRDHGFGIDQEGNVLNGRLGAIFYATWASI